MHIGSGWENTRSIWEEGDLYLHSHTVHTHIQTHIYTQKRTPQLIWINNLKIGDTVTRRILMNNLQCHLGISDEKEKCSRRKRVDQ